jgi:hypothetical protein
VGIDWKNKRFKLKLGSILEISGGTNTKRVAGRRTAMR